MSDASKNFALDPINAGLTKEEKHELLRTMVRIRKFEQAALPLYHKGEQMGGFLHLYIGQESVAAGCVSLCGADDHHITAYRCHGHGIAAGMSMNECMAELCGKSTGSAAGKGGSMHLFAPDKNFWGGHGIVGGQIPLGLGLGYGIKYQEKEGCALAFLGDGAINQGAVHESLNLAALFDVPVIFVIENNGYSMGTSQARSSSAPEILAQRAEGYNMAWESIDGSDIYEVRARMNHYMERARKESKPAFLELQTYRYYGHSVADANHKKYRSPEEIEAYKNEQDPINKFRQALRNEGVLSEEEAAQIDQEAKLEAKAAVAFAKESPAPTLESIFDHVYWEVDEQTEAGQTGRHFFND